MVSLHRSLFMLVSGLSIAWRVCCFFQRESPSCSLVPGSGGEAIPDSHHSPCRAGGRGACVQVRVSAEAGSALAATTEALTSSSCVSVGPGVLRLSSSAVWPTPQSLWLLGGVDGALGSVLQLQVVCHELLDLAIVEVPLIRAHVRLCDIRT